MEIAFFILVGIGVVLILPFPYIALLIGGSALVSAWIAIPFTWIWNDTVAVYFAQIPQITFIQGWMICLLGRIATGMNGSSVIKDFRRDE